jgi:hypothetical protein
MQFNHEEVRKPIPGYTRYDITNYGRVINGTTGRLMVLSPTLNGDLTVGLVKGDHQTRFSVKGLVARAFVEGETDVFNTPILLDGDKHNLYFENIVWRPRWFAWKYSRQFTDPEPWYTQGPIYEYTKGIMYDTFMDAAILNGILCEHIRKSIYDDLDVFPTGQKFTYPKIS